MGQESAPNLKRYLPYVALATSLVTVLPTLVGLLLDAAGMAATASFCLAVVVCFTASSICEACWKKMRDPRDLAFSELLLWGWLSRWRTEHKLSQASALLGLWNERSHAEPLDARRRTELFEELVRTLEKRDRYTHGHARRVARHSSAIAARMRLGSDAVAKIRTAAAVHDIGKLTVPRAILTKPGALTADEYAQMIAHAEQGARMVAALGDREITAMVRHHHERIDGGGYPDRLAGEAIPLGARIIAVADTFDAITSRRPYRGPKAHKTALAVLAEQAGAQLDEAAVRAFCAHYSGRRGRRFSLLVTSASERLWGSLGLQQRAIDVVRLKTGLTILAITGAVGTSAMTGAFSHPASSHRQRLAAVDGAVATMLTTSRLAHLSERPGLAAPSSPVPWEFVSRPLRRTPPGTSTPSGPASNENGPTVRPPADPASGRGSGSSPAPLANGSTQTSGESAATAPTSQPGDQTAGGEAGQPAPAPQQRATPAPVPATPPVAVTVPSATVRIPPVAVTTPSITVAVPSVPLHIRAPAALSLGAGSR